jgi:hypothetical protein
MQHLVRRLAALALFGALALAFPAIAAATISPPCSGTGHSTSGDVDLTTATEWHMESTDTAGGDGTSTAPMKAAVVRAYAFGGLSIPVAQGTSDTGETAGSVSGLSVDTYAVLGARFYVAGSASGDAGSCSGSIVIILDDVNPLLTVFGGGGLLLFLIGLIAILLLARSSGGCFLQVVAILLGLLGGAGLAIALGQFGILDATQPVGLALPAVGAVAGLGTCGRFHRSPPVATA